MCYSAQSTADYRKYVHVYGADIDIDQLFRLFWDRRGGSQWKIAKAMEALFLMPRNNARAASKNRSRRSAPDNIKARAGSFQITYAFGRR
jgi:hypothetical protein